MLPFFLAALPLSYEFPPGVPLKAAEVRWYTPTREMQDGVLAGWVHQDAYRQHWQSEFPWRTGGLDDAPADVKTFKFYRPGRGPAAVWRERSRFFSNARQVGFQKWRLPPGTVVGEVIQVAGRTVEVGFMEFVEGKDEPVFRWFRPFKGRADIPDEYVAREAVRPRRVRNVHPGRVLDVAGLAHELDLTAAGTDALLARPFVEATDVVFSERDGRTAFGPTATRPGGAWPARSVRGLFRSGDCLACHRTAGVEGRLIDPDPSPDKYGTVRGNSFVFSLPRSLALADARAAAPPAPARPRHRGIFEVGPRGGSRPAAPAPDGPRPRAEKQKPAPPPVPARPRDERAALYWMMVTECLEPEVGSWGDLDRVFRERAKFLGVEPVAPRGLPLAGAAAPGAGPFDDDGRELARRLFLRAARELE